VYLVNGTFNISGNAVVNANNDVYLASGRTIAINGTLTAPLPDYVAVIKPQAYDNSVVLSGSNTDVNAMHNRFGVVPNGSTSWTVNSSGNLANETVTVWWLGADATNTSTGKISGDSGTFVVPVGKTATGFMVGGGGGGASNNTEIWSRGGAGGEVVTIPSVSAGNYSYTIGAGGNGQAWTGPAAQQGSNTNFGSNTAFGGASGSSLPNAQPSGVDGTACPFATNLTGFTYSSQTLTNTSLKYGAAGGSKQGGPEIVTSPGDTGGGAAAGGDGNTAGSGSFYGAGGGGAQGAANGGAGHKGVIFVKLE
jgi:hypothetical protein